MKNKLFYVLFLVYGGMVALILYINGVFTGEITSLSNLVINGVFLVIIGILFLISGVSFLRLNRVTDELEDAADSLLKEYRENGNKNIWASLQERKGVFEDRNLKEAFGRYRMQVRGSRRGRHYVNACDIEEYINEELLDRVGCNFFNSGISGTMTGLGILGTFIGLSLGLGSFNGDDIYTISDNVGPLLSGMKVAFHTSVYGIIFSLIFNFVYRSIMADAYEKLDHFLSIFRQCAMPPEAESGEESLTAMLVYQANMANYMKQLLELSKGEASVQTEAMEHLAGAFLEQLQSVMGTGFQGLNGALKAAAQTQSVNLESGKRLLEAAEALVESNRQMQETMVHMLERQERLAGEIDGQKQELARTCQEISQDVSNQLYTFGQMRNLYENENQTAE